MSQYPVLESGQMFEQSMAGWKSLGPVTDVRIDDGSCLIFCGDAKVQISAWAGGIVRVRLAPDGEFGREHSWAVPERVAPAGAWQVRDDGDQLELTFDTSRVRVMRNPCRIAFLDARGRTICSEDPSKGLSWDGDEVRAHISLKDSDHFFGLGEKGCPLDKRNLSLVNWNTDAAEHEPWTDPLYQTHPFAICLNDDQAFGIFFDNAFRSCFDFGKASRTYWSFGADGGELVYYFIPGPTPADVVRNYASLVGTPHLPPMWSLGYQQCRWSYDSAKRVEKIAREFRERKIPCDTIYIDIDYMDGFRCFTWDPSRFPKPAALLSRLKREGYKVVTIIDPGLKAEPGYSAYDSGVEGDHFLRGADGEIHVGKVWPGDSVFPDFTSARTRAWWGDLYRDMLAKGVTGIWNDMNEPADLGREDKTLPLSVRFANEGQAADHRACHNVYGMQMARATFEGMQRHRANERPFVLTRAGYAGVQRFAAVWTGDNLSSWDQLRMSIPMLLNMGLSGIAFCGADIGGFRGYPTPELYTRWLQVGIFYPLCRTHTAGGREQDPWSFGRKHEKHNRRAIELRYRLLPYLYSEFHASSQTGLPVMRPVLLDFPNTARVYRYEHEFMFGRQLFVAPVLHESAVTRKILLPEGDWFDFEDAVARKGGAEFDLPVEMDSIPIFARAGAIIPMRDVIQHTDGRRLEELTLIAFPGEGGGCFYQDDGLSYNYERGEFTLEQYSLSDTGDATSFRLDSRRGTSEFAPDRYLLKFMGVAKAPLSVASAGRPLTHCKGRKAFAKAINAWRYEKKSQIVWVRLDRLTPGDGVELFRRPGTATGIAQPAEVVKASAPGVIPKPHQV